MKLGLLLLPTVLLPLSFSIREKRKEKNEWLINVPFSFSSGIARGDSLVDVRSDVDQMKDYSSFVETAYPNIESATDGENIDAIEHFFWGMRNGVSLELGALDGSRTTNSMTVDFEKFGWNRILIDGDPAYRSSMLEKSPLAFSASTAICSKKSSVHWVPGTYIGGIVEFMSQNIMREYHPSAYKEVQQHLQSHHNSFAGLNWTNVRSEDGKPVEKISCLPLQTILANCFNYYIGEYRAKAPHINFFVLDVEGGEMQVLQSIDWNAIKFDVLCIETDPTNRPTGYADSITAYLARNGYVAATKQISRNIWYIRQGFVASKRQGIVEDCFTGANKHGNTAMKGKRCL